MSNTLQTIVIGTSLSETSDDVVRTGVAIARATGATPWLVHVHSHPISSAELFGPVDGTWLEELAATLRGRLAEQAQRTGLSALPKFAPDQVHLGMGSTYGEIVELARKVKADFIVIGGSEGGALHRILVGSTADGIIRQAPCPVLVVHSAAAFPPARVEIPVDLSPISANALRQGLDFLARLGVGLAGTEALFVLNPLEVAGSLQFTPSQVEHFALDELRRFQKLNGAGAVLSQVRSGYPAEEIPAVLKEKDSDLVILGTHGRQGFERLMLGSVALGVMHRATCNLLIVPPGARLQQEAARESRDVPESADWSYVSDEVHASASPH
ncbi:MAG: universal stress protein [Thermoanaerobaculia bacterium]